MAVPNSIWRRVKYTCNFRRKKWGGGLRALQRFGLRTLNSETRVRALKIIFDQHSHSDGLQ